MVRHLSAALVLCGLGLANMHGWLDPDLLPPYDFAGYVTVVEDVRNQVLRHGETPDWNPKWFAGTTQFTSHFKERLILPLAVVFGPLRGTQLMVFLLKLAAGMVMYAGFAKYFRAPAVGLICAFAYAFSVAASYSSENVDVMLSYVLFPLIFVAALEVLRRRSVGAALVLGVLLASEFCTNPVHFLVAPLMLLLLLALRPWRRAPVEDNPLAEPGLALRWGKLGGLALTVFILFSASPMAWFALDQKHHAPHRVDGVERAIHTFAEPSPFTLFNRANWLGDWLEDHRTPHMNLFPEEPLRNQRHYLGFVALAVCVAGWFPARKDFTLRRSYQVLALLFLAQWALAMGPHSLAWQVARSFHWPNRWDGPIATALTIASFGSVAAALALWARDRRRWVGRVELALGLGLFLLVAAHPLFLELRSWTALLAHFRSPGKFMDLLPFPFTAAFGLGLVAIVHAVRAGARFPRFRGRDPGRRRGGSAGVLLLRVSHLVEREQPGRGELRTRRDLGLVDVAGEPAHPGLQRRFVRVAPWRPGARRAGALPGPGPRIHGDRTHWLFPRRVPWRADP
jgi:hypothetical protein